ncbi:MAG: hydrogenase/urease nickel incorporation protein HypA [Candidatus Marinarcus sp.]|uniref:hydrogenase/urease nickel incorporation protein HypA n=1 Tax=Candidatus Marinarcus sp. TaxID=3100987 RepID=UPI003AFF7DEA
MHEYSIVQSLLESCEEHAQQNSAKRVTKVVIKVGVLSGVEPSLLETAFNTFKEQTICHDAEFVLNIQEVVISCKECQTTSTLSKREFTCPKCQSINIDVIDGEDMYLMSLEME